MTRLPSISPGWQDGQRDLIAFSILTGVQIALTACACAQQMSLGQLGDIPPGAPVPANVTGELDLTQGFGPLDNGTYLTRGYSMTPSSVPYFSNASQVTDHTCLQASTTELKLRPIYVSSMSCFTLPEGVADYNAKMMLYQCHMQLRYLRRL